jgi:hypothetical protein
MKTLNVLAACAAAALTIVIATNSATAQQDQPIYGSQMMTDQERTQYRDRMRSAESASERERLRRENHERMKSRAKERGVTLPDEPPAQGMGRGPGMSPGGGMGPGGRSGMGPGGGMGRRGR